MLQFECVLLGYVEGGNILLSTLDAKSTELFLKTCKKEIRRGNCIFIDYRRINMDGSKITTRQALVDLGIMKKSQIWDYILELTPDECIRVSRDYDSKRDMNSEMFEFIHLVKGHKAYIKLTINEKGTVCLSFHKSKRA